MEALQIPRRISNSFLKNEKIDVSKSSPSLRSLSLDSPLTCQFPLYTKEALLPINTPVYLATDAPSPKTHPALKQFFRTFPCIYLLSDFEEMMDQWEEEEGLKKFLLVGFWIF